jgi:PAS domain S-box-containing protein
VQLAEAHEALRAIRSGEVDSVVVAGARGTQVFTLDGAGSVYRSLIESMNEGALTLTPDKVILYANRCFARMAGSPLDTVIGGSLARFLSREDGAKLGPLLKRVGEAGSKTHVLLVSVAGLKTPVQISIRPLSRSGSGGATIAMVVTDLTEARQNEEMLRALAQRIVQVQEVERGRVAFELHDNITQLICAVLFRSQALADGLPLSDVTSKEAALALRGMLERTAEEVERISRNLGPHVLDHLGLAAALRQLGGEFGDRTGTSITVACAPVAAPLPTGAEMALYRILQESLRNIEKHAAAGSVRVSLNKKGRFVRLAIHDDGTGFDPGRHRAGQKGGLGLLSMRERANSVGGTVKVASSPGTGTKIEVLIPLGADAPAGG